MRAAVVGDANLSGRTLAVANVVYTELLDALAACGGANADGGADARPAPKRARAEALGRTKRARACAYDSDSSPEGDAMDETNGDSRCRECDMYESDGNPEDM